MLDLINAKKHLRSDRLSHAGGRPIFFSASAIQSDHYAVYGFPNENERRKIP
jgi:hypothetical protein